MQPVLLTVNGTGTSPAVVMDYMQNPFQVGIGVIATGGAATAWRVEHTFDDLRPATATVTNWFLNSAIGTSGSPIGTTTLKLDMNYAFPVSAIRVNVVSATATSIVIVNISQASNAP